MWTNLQEGFCQGLFSARLFFIFPLGFGPAFALLPREHLPLAALSAVFRVIFTRCLLVWRRWVGERPFSDVLIKLRLKADISLGHCGVAFSSVVAPFPDITLGSACIPAPPPRVEFSFFPLFPCTSFSEFLPVASDCFLVVLMLNIFFLRDTNDSRGCCSPPPASTTWKLSPR